MAYLLDPNTDIPVGERSIRVEDYLNDKIQIAADLSNLTSLLDNIELKKKQLDEQVSRNIFMYF